MRKKNNYKKLLKSKRRKKLSSSKVKETRLIYSSKPLNKEKNRENRHKIEIKDKQSREEEQSRNIFKINKIL